MENQVKIRFQNGNDGSSCQWLMSRLHNFFFHWWRRNHCIPVSTWGQHGTWHLSLMESNLDLLILESLLYPQGNSESGSPSFCVESLGLGFSNWPKSKVDASRIFCQAVPFYPIWIQLTLWKDQPLPTGLVRGGDTSCRLRRQELKRRTDSTSSKTKMYVQVLHSKSCWTYQWQFDCHYYGCTFQQGIQWNMSKSSKTRRTSSPATGRRTWPGNSFPSQAWQVRPYHDANMPKVRGKVLLWPWAWEVM